MIYLTEKAAAKLAEIADAEGIGHQTVRLKILGGGCAGFSYDMTFEEVINEVDEVFEIGPAKVVIDPLSFQYLDETTIDWEDHLLSAGFKFNNPNTTGSCGCGNSVQF